MSFLSEAPNVQSHFRQFRRSAERSDTVRTNSVLFDSIRVLERPNFGFPGTFVLSILSCEVLRIRAFLLNLARFDISSLDLSHMT